jgi:hypothetical protein
MSAGPAHSRGCFLCLQIDGGFTSLEHPIAESLGNTELVLPKGIVCDRCNSGPLALLDQCLADLMPVKMRRTTLGIPNKAGTVPVTVFQDGRLEHLGPHGPALVGPAPKSWKEEWRNPRDPRWTVGTVMLTGGRPIRGRYAEQVARAVLKVGFEAAWPEQGERLMQEDFDQLREVILGTRRRHGYLFVGAQVDETDSSMNVWFDALRDDTQDVAHLMVSATLLGVRLATDSYNEKPPPGLTPDLGYVTTF